jgi:hypothetical protein
VTTYLISLGIPPKCLSELDTDNNFSFLTETSPNICSASNLFHVDDWVGIGLNGVLLLVFIILIIKVSCKQRVTDLEGK